MELQDRLSRGLNLCPVQYVNNIPIPYQMPEIHGRDSSNYLRLHQEPIEHHDGRIHKAGLLNKDIIKNVAAFKQDAPPHKGTAGLTTTPKARGSSRDNAKWSEALAKELHQCKHVLTISGGILLQDAGFQRKLRIKLPFRQPDLSTPTYIASPLNQNRTRQRVNLISTSTKTPRQPEPANLGVQHSPRQHTPERG
jgi:hypothetical protein